MLESVYWQDPEGRQDDSKATSPETTMHASTSPSQNLPASLATKEEQVPSRPATLQTRSTSKIGFPLEEQPGPAESMGRESLRALQKVLSSFKDPEEGTASYLVSLLESLLTPDLTQDDNSLPPDSQQDKSSCQEDRPSPAVPLSQQKAAAPSRPLAEDELNRGASKAASEAANQSDFEGQGVPELACGVLSNTHALVSSIRL